MVFVSSNSPENVRHVENSRINTCHVAGYAQLLAVALTPKTQVVTFVIKETVQTARILSNFYCFPYPAALVA